jgi:DNA-directed RNA polymerase specialized sigma24 family protein
VQNLGLARLIIRRRVIDLLRKDARPNNHCSLPGAANDAIETGILPEVLCERPAWTPQTQLELSQATAMVRTALSCFASQGAKQREQALLLQRYVLDEVGYTELSAELACSKNALRVRVHKAIIALRKYVEVHHPELEQLLERRSLPTDGDLDHGLAPAASAPAPEPRAFGDLDPAPGALDMPEAPDPRDRRAIESQLDPPDLARGSVMDLLRPAAAPARATDRARRRREPRGASLAKRSFVPVTWQERRAGHCDATNRARGG